MWWRLFWWIITTALTDLLTKRPPGATPAGIGDFNVPTATEGRVVPIALGHKIKISSPNCIWYGDYAALKIEESTGVIIKKDVTVGYEYELSLAYALLKNQVAGITGVWIGDERVYNGVATDVVDINRPELFGGRKEGGGFVGRIRLHNGAEDQAVSAFLQARVPDTPAYRGTSYIMVTDIGETKGALIGETPNLRYITLEVQLEDTVANGGLNDALSLGNDHHIIVNDGNPGSIAYDLFLNDRWGRGLPSSDVDRPSFVAAAETCFTEGIGFSMLIDEFTTTEEIQDFLEQHMDAYIGPNAQTGKFEVKLARPDYTLASEFQATDDVILGVPTWNKGDWTQTFNRVRMRYADRAKDWNETHAVANAPANRIIQGRLVSQEVRYPGVHDATVANKIVAREKKNLSRPIKSGTIELNRTAWQLRPGDVFSFTSSLVDETELPVRITKVEIGDPLRNTMVFEVVEDIFDNETPTVAEPPDTDFEPPTQDVDPYLAADQWAIEAPYMIVRQDPLSPSTAPRLVTGARISTGAPTEYEIRHRLPGGSGSYVSIDFTGTSSMRAGELRNSEVGWLSGNGGKTIQVDPIAGSLDDLIGTQSPGTGNMTGLAVIDPGGANEEWVLFDEIVDDLTGIRLEGVWRGALDTAQLEHTAGERIWFIWTGGLGMPSFQYTPGDTPDIKLLPRSPSDAVDEVDATTIPLVPFLSGAARFYRPLLPRDPLVGNLVDFDNVLTVTGSPVEFQGLRLAPRLRDWRNQDPLDQVQGGGIRSDIWGDDEHQVEYWLYNLQTDPIPNRGDAVVNSVASATFASDGIVDVLKSAVAAEFEAAQSNTLPMRLEVETSHVPGVGFSRITSRDVMLLDFTGQGTFIVPFGAVYVHMDFELGVTGEYRVRDLSGNQHALQPVNTDIGVDSTVSAPIGTRAYKFDDTNPATFPVNTSGYIIIPTTGAVSGDLDVDQDFTIEMRLRFIETGTTMSILGTYDGSTPGSGFIFQKQANSGAFRLLFSTDADGTTEETITFTETSGFTPTIGDWYAIMVTKKEELNGTFTFRLFRDGIKVSEVNVPGFTVPVGDINQFALGATDINRSLVSGVTGAGFDGYVDEFRFLQGVALELVDYTVPTTAHPAEGAETLIAMSNFEAEAGRDSDKLAEDLASDLLSWVYDGTTAQCRISGVKSKFGNTALYIDGTNDAGLRWGNFEPLSDIEHQDLANHDWTIEGWVNFDSLPSSTVDGMALCGSGDNGGNARNWFFGIDENDELEFSFWEEGVTGSIGNETEIKSTTTPALAIDTWYHIAVCRNGDAIEGWVDGTRVLNDATFFDNGGVPAVIGFRSQIELSVGKAFRDEVGSLHRTMDGYVDSFRITKRLPLYTGASITVPTSPFQGPTPVIPGERIAKHAQVHYHNHWNGEDTTYDPAWEQVVSLLELEGTDTDTTTTDEGSLGATWTFTGNAQIDTAQSAIGSSSLLLDGTGDYLTTADNAAWEIGAEDFALECFVRFNGDPGTAQMTFLSKWESSAGADRSWWFGLNNNQLEFMLSTNGTAASTFNEAWDPAADTWYHVAVSRRSGTIQFFVDGIQLAAGVANSSTISNEPSVVAIGAFNTASTPAGLMNGWIDQPRVTIGEGRYEDGFDFIVPTAARAQKTGFEFLRDEGPSGYGIQSTNGNPLIDTAQKKFSTASLRLDGSSYVELTDTGPGLDTNSFVIEAQVRFDGDPLTANMTIASEWNTQFNARGWILALRNNELVFEWDDSFTQFSHSGTWNPAGDTWYHVMVSKVQGMIRLFVDGTEVGTAYEVGTTDRQISNPSPRTTLGCHFVTNTPTDLFDGWIDEFRIMIGTATNGYDFPAADFTAPTSEYDWHRTISHIGEDRSVLRLGTVRDKSILEHGTAQTNCVPFNSPLKFSEVDDARGGGFSKVVDYWTSSSFMEVVYEDGMQLGNWDFTIEAWVYFDQTNPTLENMAIASHYEASGNNRSWFLRYDATLDALVFAWYEDGATINQAYFDWSTVANDTWYHVAVTREGDTIRMFLDGVLQTLNGASDTLGTNEAFFPTTSSLSWGSIDGNFVSSNPFDNFEGKMFDMRLTKGKALYTATFTPPTKHLPEYGILVPGDF